MYVCYKNGYSNGLLAVTATKYKFIELCHSTRPALATPLVSSLTSALYVAQLCQGK